MSGNALNHNGSGAGDGGSGQHQGPGAMQANVPSIPELISRLPLGPPEYEDMFDAAKVLVSIGNRAIPALQEALRSQEFLMAWYAAQTLCRIWARSGNGTLREALGAPEPHLRHWAAVELGTLGSTWESERIIAMLADDDPLARSGAAKALRKLGTQDAVPALKIAAARLHDENDAAFEAALTLAEISPDEGIDALLRIAEENGYYAASVPRAILPFAEGVTVRNVPGVLFQAMKQRGFKPPLREGVAFLRMFADSIPVGKKQLRSLATEVADDFFDMLEEQFADKRSALRRHARTALLLATRGVSAMVAQFESVSRYKAALVLRAILTDPLLAPMVSLSEEESDQVLKRALEAIQCYEDAVADGVFQ